MRITAITVLTSLIAVAAAQDATWSFTPPRDEFSDQALLDLRRLNEHEAGEKGFVHLSKDGNDFVLGDGTPARFWAYNDQAAFVASNPNARPPLVQDPWPADGARNARFLAKRGVNMVRCFINVTPGGGDINAIDEGEREVAWRMVAAMKKEGIYTLLTPYCAWSSRVVSGTSGIPECGTGSKNFPFGMVYFDPVLKQAYKAWMKALLTTVNPHTKLSLADDPALAIIQLQNEDGLFWWTFNQVATGGSGLELGRQFAAYLAKKHGSFAAATARWKGAVVKGDDLAGEAPALMPMWDMLQGGERACDQVEFLTETQRSFNAEMTAYLHGELGCKQLINAGNWKASDGGHLNDCQRYSDSPCEVIGVNRYYFLPHDGPHNGWAIENGDSFLDQSVLKNPLSFPLTLKQVEGHPTIITEINWMPPISHRSEGPFLVAAYSCLTGFDTAFWFANLGEETWRQPGSANGYMPSQGIYACASPMTLGQWPAAALLFRKGFLRQGDPVVRERRAVVDMTRMNAPILAERQGGDPMRDREILSPTSNITTPVDDHAYLVGPVSVQYGADSATSIVAKDLGSFIDTSKGEARANTGELTWNWKDGICILNAPKAQGATGFLSLRDAIALKDLAITSKNRYATVLAVALDDLPLSSSAKVLVQVGTSEQPTGWQTKPITMKAKDGKESQGEQVVSIGQAPWQVVAADITISLANPKLKKARTLDANFNQAEVADLTRGADGKATFAFPPNALYVVLTAE
jgi:hypothetical protein